jgi:hypothetical protein
MVSDRSIAGFHQYRIIHIISPYIVLADQKPFFTLENRIEAINKVGLSPSRLHTFFSTTKRRRQTTMVLFLLCMKCEAENVGEVELRRDANLRISVRNPLSDTEVRENVVFNPTETIEQEEGSREPPCHFALRWEGSKKSSVLRVLDDKEAAAALKKKSKKSKDSMAPRNYTGDDSGNWVPLLAMECRGLEPFAFHPMRDEFVIMSEGGCKFDQDVELVDGEFADYDADADCPVSLGDVQFKFEAI